MKTIVSPLQAQVVSWLVAPGDLVGAGELLVILEAMKMEHELHATEPGRVAELFASQGEVVEQGQMLSLIHISEPTRPY